MAVKENFRNYVGLAGTVGRPAQSMVILGNGLAGQRPAAADRTPRIRNRRFPCCQFFAEDDRFEVVKPKPTSFSDPMFFRDSACRDRVRALYATLARKVAWPMNLYVQYYNPKASTTARRAAQFQYPHRPVPYPDVPRFQKSRILAFPPRAGKRQFRNGGADRRIRRSAAGVYKRIELRRGPYAVGRTLRGRWEPALPHRPPLLRRSGSRRAAAYLQEGSHVPYTMADYLAEVAELFRGHEVLRDYAAALGARIVNRTRGSMIDAYERNPE